MSVVVTLTDATISLKKGCTHSAPTDSVSEIAHSHTSLPVYCHLSQTCNSEVQFDNSVADG